MPTYEQKIAAYNRYRTENFRASTRLAGLDEIAALTRTPPLPASGRPSQIARGQHGLAILRPTVSDSARSPVLFADSYLPGVNPLFNKIDDSIHD